MLRERKKYFREIGILNRFLAIGQRFFSKISSKDLPMVCFVVTQHSESELSLCLRYSKTSCRQATTKNNPFKFRLNWHTPLFSRHGIIKASLTSLTFLTFGKLQASLIFRSLNRKVRFCSWLNENNPMIVTFVLTGRTRVHCTMSQGVTLG